MKSLFAWLRRPRARPITLENARRRAARGAAYLDDVDPGWHRRIDAEALALADGGRCVLGQLHGQFRAGLGRSGLFNLGSAPRASLSPVAHGFHCVRAGDAEAERRDYALLDRAWREEVRQRVDQQQDQDKRGPGEDRLPAERLRERRERPPVPA